VASSRVSAGVPSERSYRSIRSEVGRVLRGFLDEDVQAVLSGVLLCLVVPALPIWPGVGGHQSVVFREQPVVIRVVGLVDIAVDLGVPAVPVERVTDPLGFPGLSRALLSDQKHDRGAFLWGSVR
jgi:hypothetical protein